MFTIHTYRSFSLSSNNKSFRSYELRNLKEKMEAKEASKKPHISKYEIKELLSYHNREISYSDFSKLKEQMKGIKFSDIIDSIEDIQEKLGADRFNVNRMMGHRFVHIWFKRSDTGYGSKYQFVKPSWYKYCFSFNDEGELYKVDYDIK